MMAGYAAKLEADPGGGITVTFRDIPEAITQADNLEECKEQGLEALITALDFYLEDGREVPSPTSLEEGEVVIEIPPSVATKVMLINALAEKKMRPSDLAAAMGIRRQEVNRILDLRHTTKIDTIAEAFHALGKELEFDVKAVG